ncbi:hypothetical protein MTR04_10115 [Staphylococcus agnetis]|uniref:hypothetical protein n=1 Tax=Staphylococcus agnetis TaxID=985762 RepID=UPI0019D9D58C|nr:hypothetical protein [Staphylococcus agnetis]EGQ1387243.1 hypothetical protein [Staphylococcus aureus]EGQ1439239.1 hypothetical protein [Staphylococcus aureus]EGQ1472883.1 hypothetical protein [Staphylococcus aureus]MCO4360670.1 hypothetical protein [Staphylococcus agnetis]
MSNVKKIIGYCSSQLDEIPNLIRGLGGGEQGFSLPFSLTVSQIIVIFTIILPGLFFLPVTNSLLDFLPKYGRYTIVFFIHIGFPAVFGFFIGQKNIENMNVVKFAKVYIATKFNETSDYVGREELDNKKKYKLRKKIVARTFSEFQLEKEDK